MEISTLMRDEKIVPFVMNFDQWKKDKGLDKPIYQFKAQKEKEYREMYEDWLRTAILQAHEKIKLLESENSKMKEKVEKYDAEKKKSEVIKQELQTLFQKNKVKIDSLDQINSEKYNRHMDI